MTPLHPARHQSRGLRTEDRRQRTVRLYCPLSSVLCPLSLAAALLLAPPLPAQRVAPPPPPTYDALIRYRIRAGGNERIAQFFAMTRYLESVGFQRRPSDDPSEPVDVTADRLYGTLPSNKLRDVLLEPHVRTVLLAPAGYKPPDDPTQRVLVQITLAGGLIPERQRDLYFQSLDHLAGLGFVPKVGFDNEGFTRVLGTVPAGELDTLVKDLRRQPAGWLAPAQAVDALPEPIRTVSPLRVVEVLPEPEGVPSSADVPPPPPPPPGEEYLAKLAPELRAAAPQEGASDRVRLEVVLSRTPAPQDTVWRTLLQSLPGLTVEGRIGPVVAVLAPPGLVSDLARLPEVATVRLPRPALRSPVPAPAGPPVEALAATGLDRLHRLGYRGAGVRVAVIDGDFAGAAERIGKELPKNTVFIDLTAARNPTLLPDPAPEGEAVGRGTRLALTARLAAPEADLVLIRVDPAAAYQLLTIARYLHGEAFRPESLENRDRELLADNDRLRIERARLTEERRELAQIFTDDEATEKRRRDVLERSATLDRDERLYLERLRRFYKLEEDLIGLRNVRVVVNPLTWDAGYPVDASGTLSRYLDDVLLSLPRQRPYGSADKPVGPQVWFQAAGNTRGQAWGGRLIDPDGNGAFTFAAPGTPLPKGRWTTELNFLAWQPAGGERAFDLPAGARVRLTLQWTEAHDPAADSAPGPDPYRAPVADLRLLVLRQRDPTGTRLSTDDFNVVARAAGLPQMIARAPNWATYEHVVEFAPDAAGRFALRLEGSVPPTIRPRDFPSVPALDRFWEPTARLFAEVADPAARGQGRPVFGDFATGLGGLGAPGNAKLPRTVGAADAQGRPQPYSAAGAPAGQELLAKPRLLAFDELPLPGLPAQAGTGPATAFAGGMLAAMLSAGAPASSDLHWLDLPPGGLLRVPPAWLDQVERRWPKTGRE